MRAGKRGFKVMGLPGNGLAWDFLMGAGAVDQAEICHMSLADYGPAPNFKRLCQDGRLKVIENTCGIALSMAQAAAVGSPFLAVRGLYGTDVMAIRDDFKVIDDPYQPGEQIVVAPALRPDVFITHGLMADRYGNVITVDGGRNDFLAAQAAKKHHCHGGADLGRTLDHYHQAGLDFYSGFLRGCGSPNPPGIAPGGIPRPLPGRRGAPPQLHQRLQERCLLSGLPRAVRARAGLRRTTTRRG